MTTARHLRSPALPDAREADPADVAEQQATALADDPAVTERVGEVGEADPADVYEQDLPVPTDDDGWDRG